LSQDRQRGCSAMEGFGALFVEWLLTAVLVGVTLGTAFCLVVALIRGRHET
jgi:hypothetical protein